MRHMSKFKLWIKAHPTLWEFILFNLLSNCATIVNFAVMWLCTGFVFVGLQNQPFQWLLFQYTTEESLGLCGFLSFLTATAAAQTVNFFVQKELVFRSDAQFAQAVPKYIILAVTLVIISAALPAYSQRVLASWGVSRAILPTLANVINILTQVALSYPAMKFWIMPTAKKTQCDLKTDRSS